MAGRRLLLIGGGHAHLRVLADWADDPVPGVEVVLVTPHAQQIYSGMLPGWIAGHYRPDDIVIDVAVLAAAAGIVWRQGTVGRLDPTSRRAWIDEVDRVAGDGAAAAIDFDVASIDIGSAGALPVALAASLATPSDMQVLPIRPLDAFVERLTAWRAQLVAGHDASTAARVAVVGGGPGGFEVAAALAWSLRAPTAAVGGADITLVSGPDGLLPAFGIRVRQRARAALERRGVDVIDDTVASTGADGLVLARRGAIGAGLVIAATGAAAHPWPRSAGLAVDARGFIVTDDCLRSPSHPAVFAAGDCATMPAHPRPQSGVYAVRAGMPLSQNLRRVLRGDAPRPYRPQGRALYLLATGPRHAIAVWGPAGSGRGTIAVDGDWVWRWKDRIDRAFVARYRRAAEGGQR